MTNLTPELWARREVSELRDSANSAFTDGEGEEAEGGRRRGPALWMVEVYAPWCSHCMKGVPQYKRAAAALARPPRCCCRPPAAHRCARRPPPAGLTFVAYRMARWSLALSTATSRASSAAALGSRASPSFCCSVRGSNGTRSTPSSGSRNSVRSPA